jgi:hypothetical protein
LHVLKNRRRFARKEKRQVIGKALGIARRDHAALGCVESSDVFLLIKPSSSVRTDHFTEKELRPLLRQAIVAISAAVESYVAEKASTYASAALDARPDRLKDVALSLDKLVEIESRYKRRRVVHRAILEEYLELTASPSPSKVGLVFSTARATSSRRRRRARDAEWNDGERTRRGVSTAEQDRLAGDVDR